MDFVAYVAKDMQSRACHVIECGGGLAQDVITTIGQAFELRFKSYLAQKAVPLSVPSRYVKLQCNAMQYTSYLVYASYKKNCPLYCRPKNAEESPQDCVI